MREVIEDYRLSIRIINHNIKYYVSFYNENRELNEVEVDKDVFLQLFGVHKIKRVNKEKNISYVTRITIICAKCNWHMKTIKNLVVLDCKQYKRRIKFKRMSINIH